MMVKTDNVSRDLAVSSRLRSQNLMSGAPISQKRYVIELQEENGFHIWNQRGRFNPNRISEQNKKMKIFLAI